MQRCVHVRFGSKADVIPNTQLRLLPGAKRTLDVRFLSPKLSCAAEARGFTADAMGVGRENDSGPRTPRNPDFATIQIFGERILAVDD